MIFLNRFTLFFVIGLLVVLAGLWISGGKEEKYSTSLEITASPEQVFPYLTEPDRLISWVEGLEQIDKPLPPQEGQLIPPNLLRTMIDKKGQKVFFDDVVIRYIPSEMLSIRSTNAAQTFTTVYQLERTVVGKTQFSSHVMLNFLGFERFLAPLKKTDIQSQVIANTRRLKTLIEANEEFIPLVEKRPTDSGVGADGIENDKSIEDVDVSADADPPASPAPNDKQTATPPIDLEAEFQVPGFGDR